MMSSIDMKAVKEVGQLSVGAMLSRSRDPALSRLCFGRVSRRSLGEVNKSSNGGMTCAASRWCQAGWPRM
jgi:hypothetical protein